MRTYLDTAEDRLLATVFLDSSLLFLGMSLGVGAATNALLGAGAVSHGQPIDAALHACGGRLAYTLQNDFALRVAGVCMFSLATLGRRSGALPSAPVWGTFLIGAVLLIGLSQVLWLALVYPVWVLLLSLYMLHRPPDPSAGRLSNDRSNEKDLP